jgi:hypothetical protein
MMVNPKIARQTSPLKPKGVNDFDDFSPPHQKPYNLLSKNYDGKSKDC